jgi:3-hydroxyisobutyrate dehydrogenase-like beta-hydroxyacid dehydrogenase
MIQPPRIVFVGLGHMGKPMSRNLMQAGFPLTVFNRSRPALDELAEAGARVAESVADLVESTDIVLTSLPTVEASETVFLERDGIVARGRRGQTFVELSTIGPALARRIGKAAERRGAGFLDAPVSGGPEGACAATLTIMVGGDPEVLGRVDPILRALGTHVRRIGEIGAGSTAKLVNQVLTAIHTASAAEALVLAAAAGTDPDALLEVLESSYGQSRMLARSGPRMLDRDFDGGAPLRLLIKDLALVEELATQLGAPLPLTTVVQTLCAACEAMDLGEADLAALVRPFECEAGLKVTRAPNAAPRGGTGGPAAGVRWDAV